MCVCVIVCVRVCVCARERERDRERQRERLFFQKKIAAYAFEPSLGSKPLDPEP